MAEKLTHGSWMIVGVGGQGTLLASRILGSLLMRRGYDVKVSEVHGMSQRGGSVVTYVKFGEKVYSPTIEPGEADLILAFEPCEAARWAGCLRSGGLLLTNTQRLSPMPVITGAAQYPDDVLEKLAALPLELAAVDALRLAEEAGSSRAVNVALLGALSARLDFAPGEWETALAETVKPRFLELNLRAFRLGREMK